MSFHIFTEERLIGEIMKYTGIELFAGAGGLALGLEEAGIEGQLFVEFDQKACETLRENRPDLC